MAKELAKAYVKIIPNMGGVGEAITKEFGDAGDTAGKSSGRKFGNAFKSAGATALKVGGAAIAAAATAIGATVKSAVEGYADYEQLVGGVETLFKDSSDIVQQYAANAYQTAGLSANQYMETVTGFSASLLQSLGGDTEAAAQYADMAITDMADNANKMGTDMESIQNAYQGFAKQNYTMLDNLKLGYGGTKEEMERLLADATAISGIEYDVSSYADVVEAIHVIQTEMGIAGTTALEANTTIQGSLSSLKASWQNLLVGLADPNADLGVLIQNMVTSAQTALTNLLPIVSQALTGIGTALQQLAPIIAEMLPGLVQEVLPSLLTAATSLLDGVVAALPALLTVLVQQAPMIISTIVTSLMAQLPQIISLAMQLILALAMGLIQALPTLIASLPTIISTMVSTLISMAPQILGAGVQLIVALAQGVIGAVGNAVRAVGQIFSAIRSAVTGWFSSAVQWGRDLISNFIGGIKAKVASIGSAVSGIGSTIKSFIGFSEPEKGPLSNFHTFAPDMMMLFAQGIRENMGLVTSAVDGVANEALNHFGGLNGDISVNGSYSSSKPAVTSVTVPAINIYTQEGQDAYAIAEQVGYVLGLQVRQKGAVYA